MTKKSILSVKLPGGLREKTKEIAEDGEYLNESDFAREAIREKIERHKKAKPVLGGSDERE